MTALLLVAVCPAHATLGVQGEAIRTALLGASDAGADTTQLANGTPERNVGGGPDGAPPTTPVAGSRVRTSSAAIAALLEQGVRLSPTLQGQIVPAHECRHRVVETAPAVEAREAVRV